MIPYLNAVLHNVVLYKSIEERTLKIPEGNKKVFTCRTYSQKIKINLPDASKVATMVDLLPVRKQICS